jgi:hypothetical protein
MKVTFAPGYIFIYRSDGVDEYRESDGDPGPLLRLVKVAPRRPGPETVAVAELGDVGPGDGRAVAQLVGGHRRRQAHHGHDPAAGSVLHHGRVGEPFVEL